VERPLDRSAAGDIVEPKIDGDLLIYNWAQYMDPQIKKDFAEEHGIRVSEVNFDNLEAMVTKLRAGGAYDLIFPSSEYVKRLRNEQLIRQFDRSKLPNAATLSPFYDSPWYDPNSEFSLPYAYYTTGIAWRTDQDITMTGSWNATFTTSGQGITAKSTSWNGTLAPGAWTTFGLQASRPTGDTSLPTAYTCTTP
jgi:spermidine/putrescine transport system substrate-binding protein